MSFIGSLFRGFIRSAVYQVGRDGGRIISNKIYRRGSVTTAGRQPSLGSNLFFFSIWTLLLPNILIHTIVGIVSFIIPIFFLNRMLIPFSTYFDLSSEYSRQNNYGNQIGSGSSLISEMNKLKRDGLLKLIVLTISYSVMLYTFYSPQYQLRNMTINEKLSFVKIGDTLYKNDKFIYFYGLVADGKVKSYQQMAYDTIGTSFKFLDLDSIPTNADNRTEMQKVKGSPEYVEFTPTYEIMFKVEPFLDPIPNFNFEAYKKKRIGTHWYLHPDDINIGEKKLQLKE